MRLLSNKQLIILDELELDHLNPADVAKRLNRLVCACGAVVFFVMGKAPPKCQGADCRVFAVDPEMALHGVLMVLCLLAWAPWIFLLNLPIAVWHARR